MPQYNSPLPAMPPMCNPLKQKGETDDTCPPSPSPCCILHPSVSLREESDCCCTIQNLDNVLTRLESHIVGQLSLLVDRKRAGGCNNNNNNQSIQHPLRTTRRTSCSNGNNTSVRSVYRTMEVASVVYSLVLEGHTATQRDIYYRMEKHFETQVESNAVIASLAKSLKVPRRYMNVMAGGRGAIGGCIRVDGVDLRHVGPQGLQVDGSMTDLNDDDIHHQGIGGISSALEEAEEGWCASTAAGCSGESFWDCRRLDVSAARYLLIVEKDAVFYRLMQERLFDMVPVIIVSGFGFPSAAAKALVAAVLAQGEEGGGGIVETFGLVDYNPAGVQILLQYLTPSVSETNSKATSRGTTCGGGGSFAEAGGAYPGVPSLRWLGLRSKHLSSHAVQNQTQPLTGRDERMLQKMIGSSCTASDQPRNRSGARTVPQRWHDELLKMRDLRRRADIESMYRTGSGAAQPSSTNPSGTTSNDDAFRMKVGGGNDLVSETPDLIQTCISSSSSSSSHFSTAHNNNGTCRADSLNATAKHRISSQPFQQQHRRHSFAQDIAQLMLQGDAI